MDLDVASDAAAYIVDRGGRLYLWQEPFGEAWLKDQIGFEEPALGLSFTQLGYGIAGVFVSSEIPPPEVLRITLRRFPLRGLRVEWDGRAWGSRGDAAGPSGDG